MNTVKIPIVDTHYIPNLAKDYIKEDPNLASFYNDYPSVEKIIRSTEKRKFNPEKNRLLAKVLTEQFETAGYNWKQHSKVEQNILDLENGSPVWTVTTGQQIHPYLGPALVWHKIYSLINWVKQLNETQQIKVIPIFWMATEDHDFQEIKSLKIYNDQFDWIHPHINQAVGRLSTSGLTELGSQLDERLDDSIAKKEFLTICKKAYDSCKTFASATQKILMEYFGDYGILALDPDNTLLKKQFLPIATAEINGKAYYNSISKQTEVLKAKGYDVQVNPRRTHLFYLNEKGERYRIDEQDNGNYKLNGTETTFTPPELVERFNKSPQLASPNAILRPVYQECILNNIAYLAGGSEIKYWLQLKSGFKILDIPFPTLILRGSALFLNQKKYDKLTQLISIEKYFLEQSKLVEYLSELMQAEIQQLNLIPEKIQQRIVEIENQIQNSALSNIGGHGPILAKLKKSASGLEGWLNSATQKLLQNNPHSAKILKDQSIVFNSSLIQERKSSIIEMIDVLHLFRHNKLLINELSGENLLIVCH